MLMFSRECNQNVSFRIYVYVNTSNSWRCLAIGSPKLAEGFTLGYFTRHVNKVVAAVVAVVVVVEQS